MHRMYYGLEPLHPLTSFISARPDGEEGSVVRCSMFCSMLLMNAIHFDILS